MTTRHERFMRIMELVEDFNKKRELWLSARNKWTWSIGISYGQTSLTDFYRTDWTLKRRYYRHAQRKLHRYYKTNYE